MRSLLHHWMPLAAVLLALGLGLGWGRTSLADEAPRYGGRVLGMELGLPGNSVRALLQSKDGYLWSATDAGVARYDGLGFVVFNRANSPGLPSDDCRSLAEAADGSIWIGTGHGLARFRDGEVQTVSPPPLPKDLFHASEGDPVVGQPVDHVAASGDGQVWVTAGKTAYRRSDEGGEWLRLVRWNPGGAEAPRFNGFHSLHPHPDGSVWAVTDWGPGRRSSEGGSFEVRYVANTNALGHRGYDLAIGPSGEVWATIGQESDVRALLTRWTGDRWTPVSDHHVVNHSRPLFIVAGASGDLWLPDQPHRLVRFREGRWTPVSLPAGAAEDFVVSLTEDRDGDLWVGTEGRGLVHLRPQRIASFGTAEGLPDDNVRAVLETRDGTLWLGTDGGLVAFRSGRIQQVHLTPAWSRPQVRSLLEDRTERLWIGSREGLGILSTNGFRTLAFEGDWHRSKIRSLVEDREGRIWVASAGGLFRLHGEAIDLHQSLEDLGIPEVTVLLCDRRGRVWLGTEGGGVLLFDGESRRQIRTTEGLAGNRVTAMLEDDEGTLWIAGEGGLSVLRGERWHRVTPREGLPAEAFNQILDDGMGRLWVGSDHGVCRFSRDDVLAVIEGRSARFDPVCYGLDDGLPTLETHGVVSHPAGCRDRDGRLWIPTVRGVAVVDPGFLPDAPTVPVPIVELVRANGRLLYHNGPRPDEPIDTTEPRATPSAGWTVPAASARYLEFHWNAPTFRSAAAVRFAYRLEGIDRDWIDAGVRRQAFYANLGPGLYRFHIRARDAYGRMRETESALALRLTPQLHQNPWFVGFVGLAALALAMALHRWREKHLRRIRGLEAEMRLLRERERLARDLHDGVGGHLTQIALLADWERQSAPGDADPRFEQLSRASREAVQSLKDVIWSTRPDHDTLGSLVGRIEVHTAASLAAAGMRCRLDIPEDLPPDLAVPLTTRVGVFYAVKEVLNNAVRHSGARSVKLAIAKSNGDLVIAIEDDGCGFDPASMEAIGEDKGRIEGLGLFSLRHRLEALGGSFELESRPGAGTRVRLRVPLNGPGPGL